MKLSESILLKLGFRGEGRDITNKPAYRLEVPRNAKYGYYGREIQIVLGDYPDTNPNCGILSLYMSGIKDAHMIMEEKDSEDRADHILWEDKENGLRGGIKYIDMPERVSPIAYYVNTLERLNEIYCALTGNIPLVLRDQPSQESDREENERLKLELESYKQRENDPYWYWPQCDVDECDGVSCNGGGCWRETGYWSVCSEHSDAFRKGKPQPKMKQSSIEREALRDKKTGYLNSKEEVK